MIIGMQHSKGQVCVKIINDDKEVSLALDDSCQQALPTTFIRSSICIFQGEGEDYKKDNITKTVFDTDEVLGADGNDLMKALSAIGFNDKLELENAALCSLVEAMANEFMTVNDDGTYSYELIPKLANQVNTLLGLK